jgi:hypothetical protein
MNAAALTAAYMMDNSLRPMGFELEMLFIRQGIRELPPPPPLQRAERWNAELAIHMTLEYIQKFPRLLYVIRRWIAGSESKFIYKLKEEMAILIAFFKTNELMRQYEPNIIEMATLLLVRQQMAIASAPTARLHAAIRQLILARLLLRDYADERVQIYKDIGRIPQPPRILQSADFTADITFAFAAVTIEFYMEDEYFRPMRKAVHLGRTLVRRFPLLLAYSGIDGDVTSLHLRQIAGILWHAETDEEVEAAAAAAGIWIRPYESPN